MEIRKVSYVSKNVHFINSLAPQNTTTSLKVYKSRRCTGGIYVSAKIKDHINHLTAGMTKLRPI